MRLTRLRQRGPAWLEAVAGDLSDFVAWGDEVADALLAWLEEERARTGPKAPHL